jgi:hypothetical protein
MSIGMLMIGLDHFLFVASIICGGASALQENSKHFQDMKKIFQVQKRIDKAWESYAVILCYLIELRYLVPVRTI